MTCFNLQLQTKGYTNLDALDPDRPTLDRVRELGLYRNYICRSFDHHNLTGIREDVYDAVVMVGGISPEAIQELLRVTRPGKGVFLTIKYTI